MRQEKTKSPAMQMPTIFRVSETPVSLLSPPAELSSVSKTFAVYIGATVPSDTSARVVSGATVDASAGFMLIRSRTPVAFAA